MEKRMLEFGRMNTLKVHVIDHPGAWLQAGREKVLLPKREVPEGLTVGDTVSVFVYADVSGRPVATLRQPLAEVGEFALMRVSQVNEHGAFMDWGLSKDLLVPPREQPEPMKPGRSYLVKVRLDREGRPIGTGRVDKCLCSADETLANGQEVELIVWQFTPLGAKVIINHRFGGLLYRDEIGDRLNYGDRLKGYIRQIRADGKVDCTLSLGTRSDLDNVKGKIMQALVMHHGFLPLHDKSPADRVQKELGLSKKVFKKAVGGLFKAGLVELTDSGIRLKEK
jgi:predicted RNA-binding protein (virulence factor B family)